VRCRGLGWSICIECFCTFGCYWEQHTIHNRQNVLLLSTQMTGSPVSHTEETRNAAKRTVNKRLGRFRTIQPQTCMSQTIVMSGYWTIKTPTCTSPAAPRRSEHGSDQHPKGRVLLVITGLMMRAPITGISNPHATPARTIVRLLTIHGIA